MKTEESDPPKPPAPRPAFMTLRAPDRLWIPQVMWRGQEPLTFKDPESRVGSGDSLLAASSEMIFAALAPVAGKLKSTTGVRLLGNRPATAVLLETDRRAMDRAHPVEPHGLEPLSLNSASEWLRSHTSLELSDIVHLLLRAGVWADRWTSPDLIAQLQACIGRRVDTVICSLLDADPSLGVNKACAMTFPVEIVTAVAVLSRLCFASRTWIAINGDDDPRTWKPVERSAAALASDLRLVPIANHYPQADPSLLLHSLTGRGIPFGQLPTDRHVLLFDAAAAVAMGSALIGGEPMLRVPMAIHDRIAVSEKDAPGQTHLITVAVGTPLGNVLAQLDVGLGMFLRGGASHRCEMRAGAPLREIRPTAQSIVAGGELTVLVSPREPAVNPAPCIRCGWCVEGCPVRAHPAGLLQDAQTRDLEEARRHGLGDCTECGICSYVCPSNLPLLAAIRGLRES